jgi:hypothetical protein
MILNILLGLLAAGFSASAIFTFKMFKNLTEEEKEILYKVMSENHHKRM